MTISVPDTLWEKYYEACDFFIDNNYIGKACTLVYPPIKTSCAHCSTTHVGGTSTNVYVHGGPAPFSYSDCPMCGGNGYREEESTDTIRLRIYWERRNWIKVSEIHVPDAEVQIIGYMSDLKKLRQADSIRLINDVQQATWNMMLACEPFPWGFGKNRYFVAFLKREI